MKIKEYMKSYNTLEECILSKSSDDFIFKQNHLQKSYSYGSLEMMKKFQKKHKCNLYEYVDYALPIRLFFYIYLHNSKNNFEDIFSHIIKVLKFNKNDFIVIQENDISFRIIHKYLYVSTFENLDNFLFKHNLYNITLHKSQFVPCLYNNDVIITEKYNFVDSILNNTDTLLEFKTDTNILTKTITSQYIQNIEFDNSDTLFIKSGMGSGKSTATVNYIKKKNISSFLILSCRKTLTYTIYENEVLVEVPKDGCNVSMNPSATYKPPIGNEKSQDALNSNGSGEIILPGFLSGSMKPYITTIGLYNEAGQLLALGKLAQPIKKRSDVDMNFLIRLDLDKNITK